MKHRDVVKSLGHGTPSSSSPSVPKLLNLLSVVVALTSVIHIGVYNMCVFSIHMRAFGILRRAPAAVGYLRAARGWSHRFPEDVESVESEAAGEAMAKQHRAMSDF